MANSRIKYRKMATATRRAAKRYFKRSMVHFSDEPEMVRMFTKDLSLLRQFAKFVNQGQLTRAHRVIDKMDTACYDEIPNSVYNYVNDSVYGRD